MKWLITVFVSLVITLGTTSQSQGFHRLRGVCHKAKAAFHKVRRHHRPHHPIKKVKHWIWEVKLPPLTLVEYECTGLNQGVVILEPLDKGRRVLELRTLGIEFHFQVGDRYLLAIGHQTGKELANGEKH